MHLLISRNDHFHCYRNLSETARELIHQTWPETRQIPVMDHYLLNIPEEVGRAVGAAMPQEDAEVLVQKWPELNHFLESYEEQQT